MQIRLSNGKEIPIEMHKVEMVQKTRLVPIDERLNSIQEAGYNTFALRTKDIFSDMLTDSGTNAVYDNQQATMMAYDDAHSAVESLYKFAQAMELKLSREKSYVGAHTLLGVSLADYKPEVEYCSSPLYEDIGARSKITMSKGALAWYSEPESFSDALCCSDLSSKLKEIPMVSIVQEAQKQECWETVDISRYLRNLSYNPPSYAIIFRSLHLLESRLGCNQKYLLDKLDIPHQPSLRRSCLKFSFPSRITKAYKSVFLYTPKYNEDSSLLLDTHFFESLKSLILSWKSRTFPYLGSPFLKGHGKNKFIDEEISQIAFLKDKDFRAKHGKSLNLLYKVSRK